MENEFFSLQDFMTFTKGITYLLIVAILLGITAFWQFLTGRDKDEISTIQPHSE